MYSMNASVCGSHSPVMTRSVPVIFVVDCDASVRASMEMAALTEGWELVTCASAREFLSRWQVLVPCCLVLNMLLPDIGGLDLLRQVTADRPDMPVISVADQSDVLLAVRAMKAGAVEFFAKPFDERVVIEAMRAAVALSEAAQQRESERRALRERFESLSKREREVVSLVVKGMMNKQVGGILDISEITVKAHRGKAMQKMRAASLPDLVNMAAELGIGNRYAAQTIASEARPAPPAIA
jgi:FixJ family two-component response regulator